MHRESAELRKPQHLLTLLLMDLVTALGALGAAMVLEDTHSTNTFHVPRHGFLSGKNERVLHMLPGILRVFYLH
jgi:hypothetical protein